MWIIFYELSNCTKKRQHTCKKDHHSLFQQMLFCIVKPGNLVQHFFKEMVQKALYSDAWKNQFLRMISFFHNKEHTDVKGSL